MTFVLEESDIRKAIVGVPLFTHSMIAFCAVFLLKVAWKWNSAHLHINARQVEDLVKKIVELMSTVVASKKHLTYYIANGLARMLERLRSWNSSLHGQDGQVMQFTPPPLLPETAFDTFATYGFEFDDTWNDFSNNTLNLFSSTMGANGYDGNFE